MPSEETRIAGESKLSCSLSLSLFLSFFPSFYAVERIAMRNQGKQRKVRPKGRIEFSNQRLRFANSVPLLLLLLRIGVIFHYYYYLLLLLRILSILSSFAKKFHRLGIWWGVNDSFFTTTRYIGKNIHTDIACVLAYTEGWNAIVSFLGEREGGWRMSKKARVQDCCGGTFACLPSSGFHYWQAWLS